MELEAGCKQFWEWIGHTVNRCFGEVTIVHYHAIYTHLNVTAGSSGSIVPIAQLEQAVN